MSTSQSRLGAATLRAICTAAMLAIAGVAHAGPVINLGAAGDYSGFFFGNLTAHSDIEGRLAVRGNLSLNSISVGYRNPSPHGASGSQDPSLVVGGNIKIGGGAIYNGPSNPAVDSNAGMGPTGASWLTQAGGVVQGTGVYGGNDLGSAGYLSLSKGDQASIQQMFTDTAALLQGLSADLGALASTGTVTRGWDLLLRGGSAGTGAGLQVFNIADNNIKPFTLDAASFDADDYIIINLTAGGTLKFGFDWQGSQLSRYADRLIFNVLNADKVELHSGFGTLLARQADIVAASSGHWEGSVIANNMLSTLEIGYEPLREQEPPARVPEPQGLALVAAALGALALAMRRRLQR
ncbi:choice-of-anchor A family protein [Pelomonas sp. SE-A7]|uniref:choice-of-anchor A family protein n=1 Tax=Pelomonas sp. SE-A7 TaxID=3054953 RepID=UPI00259CB7FD|nr:choice-of-anchor A family protein [Pelomonas sp. SE-A7]MDM4767473.1 choice-of-anchor A family protein [Pelomonas sp. SE-A7]